MANYTDHELEQMLAGLESDWAERKESFKGDAPTSVREAVCGFANDLPNHQRSGVVFIGAKDNGVPSSIAITDALLIQLADIKTDGNILPPPTLPCIAQKLSQPYAISTGSAQTNVSVEASRWRHRWTCEGCTGVLSRFSCINTEDRSALCVILE